MNIKQQQGFTLVEISIAMTIIALVVGGIFGSASILRSLELKKIGTEAADIRTGMQAFKDRYGALPGDFTDATQVWGAADASAVNCVTTDSTNSQATCNGNGDGLIAATSTANLFYTGSEDYEIFRAWQQLANAGLVEASFSGISVTGSTREVAVGTNVMESRGAKGAGWSFFSVQPRTSNSNCTGLTVAGRSYSVCNLGAAALIGKVIAARGASAYASYASATVTNFSNVLLYGGDVADELNSKSVLTPEEAKSLDLKLDDGNPDSGQVIGVADGSDALVIDPCFILNATTGIAEYNLNFASTAAVKGCGLMWTQAF